MKKGTRNNFLWGEDEEMRDSRFYENEKKTRVSNIQKQTRAG